MSILWHYLRRFVETLYMPQTQSRPDGGFFPAATQHPAADAMHALSQSVRALPAGFSLHGFWQSLQADAHSFGVTSSVP